MAVYSLYMPIGLSFGSPKYQHIISFFATDMSETEEFLFLIPIKNYIYALLAIVAIFIVRKIFIIKKINFLNNKSFLVLSSLFIFYHLIPGEFFRKTYGEYKHVKAELDKLNDKAYISNWGKSELKSSTYDDYVLIIGESARADYFNTYGYPIQTTPFISSSNGVFINGLLAAGGYTIGSLKLMLTKPDTKTWKENYSLNLIDLVKSAGIKTYWLSNQGFIGKWDTPITGIANRSDFKFFLKSGEYDSKNTQDVELLPKFKDEITQNYNGKRFIVLHLYGSHPNACDRIAGYPKLFNDKEIDSKYTYINCYISSIKQTDEFIKDVIDTLRQNEKKNKRTFSLIYFSDHGLGHKEINNKIVLNNSPDLAKGMSYYSIPLFKISSDDTDRKVYNAFKSGLNFTDGIARWIGITNGKLNDKADLFSNTDDPDDYGQRSKLNKITKEDSAIDISPK